MFHASTVLIPGAQIGQDSTRLASRSSLVAGLPHATAVLLLIAAEISAIVPAWRVAMIAPAIALQSRCASEASRRLVARAGSVVS